MHAGMDDVKHNNKVAATVFYPPILSIAEIKTVLEELSIILPNTFSISILIFIDDTK